MGNSAPKETTEPPVPLTGAAPRKYKRVYANYIRTIAACSVVQMHSVGEYIFQFNAANPNDIRWLTADIYYSLLRWATPFFIMLSGMFMLSPSRHEPTQEFLKKRVGRVLVPFAFWSVIYLTYDCRGYLWDGTPIPWATLWHRIVFEDVYFHLWFIPMITSLYLLTPTFRILIRNSERRDIEYFLVLAFAVTALQHWIPNLFVVKYVGWLGYIGFYVLGYYLDNYPFAWKKIFYPLAWFMPPLAAVGTWWLSKQSGTYDNRIFVYFSPNVGIITIAFFVFLRDFEWSAFDNRYPWLNGAVNRFAELSFGVYFIHVLLLDVLKNGYFGFRITSELYFDHPVHPLLGGFLQAVTTIVLALTAVSIMDRIPGVRKWMM